VQVVAADFNTWESDGRHFDFILSRASLNHLYASERHAMRDPITFDAYVGIARKIHCLLAPGGVFVATDACRYAFFTAVSRFGLRRPWRRERTGVNWRHHQNPRTWRTIFAAAGFTDLSVGFPVPYRLRGFARLVGTAGANFFLNGSFILRARRSGADA
jgi:SAM-dependent methyltransferase